MPPFLPDLGFLIISTFSGAIAGAFFMWLYRRNIEYRQQEPFRIKVVEFRTERDLLLSKISSLESAYQNLAEDNQRLKIRIAQLQEAQSAQSEKLQWTENARKQMQETFEALAGRALERNADVFIKNAHDRVNALMNQTKGDWNTHKAELRNLVDPVRENLSLLDSHVRELEQKREGAYQGLTEQLTQLSRVHNEMQATAITLAQALKSPTVRGQWGEMQLRRVVEMAGMVRHVNFAEQINTQGGRPDMIIHLPNSGLLPVDSKVPLKAFLEAYETSDENIRKSKLVSHSKAMRSRVRELSLKKYWTQFDNAPDFIVMFVPSEACLSAAFENDPDLLEYAISQQIIVAGPVTLIALLKTIVFGWNQQEITENARGIAKQGQELYARLEIFASHMAEMRNHLNKAVEGYNKSIGSFERRLLPIARKFQDMDIAQTSMEEPQKIDICARDFSSPVNTHTPDFILKNSEKAASNHLFQKTLQVSHLES
ncbi:DNA recombination protein domain-containing protein, RmuC-like [Desulfonema limicola]|uniref:DNA recombination protein domain-containing protein, RmuC-like n=1 Tax=Desulfonema limicola TaxID=45656 RepID=A0A975BD06_9BACT|nr:DNA recombination protein RmuC [Desulfonema limicola]QTA83131.1 DNA recombination protein domain-containing protein, RmuC-like [Desulfonema limicola]